MTVGDPPNAADTLAARLEGGELLAFTACPFALPPVGQLDFLRRQEGVGFGHKDVCYDPARRRLAGATAGHPSELRRVADVLAQFSAAATQWVKAVLPDYAAGLCLDRVTLRTQEEAIRPLRLTARNDLLHIDSFSTRPALGRRILRVYVNIHPTDSQVWATSERFDQLLARAAARHRIPSRTAEQWVAPPPSVVRLFTGQRTARSAYDAWMLRLHHHMKENEAFQSQAARRLWTFAPDCAWILFSDGLAHALMRGRFALEHSYFVPHESLTRPEQSPLSQLVRAGVKPHIQKAG